MKTFIKSLAILAIVFVLRTLCSCGNSCLDFTKFFDFHSVEMFNLDNTGTYPVLINQDVFVSRAVAFEVVVKNKSIIYDNWGWNNFFSFSSSYATEECSNSYFRANDSIVKINIKTLYDINSKILANSDVTDNFVCTKRNFMNPENLYIPINEIYSHINRKLYVDVAVEQFDIFLKDEILNDTAQFIIYVQLKNKVVLTDTTHLLSIKHLQ